MNIVHRELMRLTDEKEVAATTSDGVRRQERDQLVSQALDFAATAKRLQGPALRELISRWIRRAEFNTSTRELTVGIRRVPSVATGLPQGGFVTEGEGFEPPSPCGRRFSRPVQ